VPSVTESVNTREADRDRARGIAEHGLILRGLVGSTVHGLSNPGTDDRDEMGVCIEPPEYVIGLRGFEHYISRSKPEGVPSGPGDLDLTIYGLRKFCCLALKGSPTVLLLFFIEGEHLLQRTQAGAELQALAPSFLSKRIGRAFLGYLGAQRRSLLGERHATRTRESRLSTDTTRSTRCTPCASGSRASSCCGPAASRSLCRSLTARGCAPSGRARSRSTTSWRS